MKYMQLVPSKMDKHTAMKLMKEYLHEHYVNEMLSEIEAQNNMSARTWLDQLLSLQDQDEYEEIEQDFYEFVAQVDTRVWNVIGTVMDVFIKMNEDVVITTTN